MTEAFKEEINKHLIEIQENAIKWVKKMNKGVQDLKRKIEAKKKTQSGATPVMENLGKRSGAADASITNRIQEIEENLRHIRYNKIN
jgi:predicted  nucleic acid-binding Zn-ribbon protein